MRIDKGIHRLATAMLLQAVQDAMSASNGRRRSALRWMNSRDYGPYSFQFTCRVINRDPDQVRQFCLTQISQKTVSTPAIRSWLDETPFAASTAA
jgi:hypothetical protein